MLNREKRKVDLKRRRRVDHISVRHYKHASEEELEYMSLEKQVTEYMPLCFLWQTATDELVPVQKSFLFAQALQEKKIPYAFHVFSKGKHGLSLADEWIRTTL